MAIITALTNFETEESMSKSINKVALLGNLGKDPEVKYSPSGTAVAKFSLATTSRTKEGGGDWQDKTEWHSIVAFGKTAEIVEKYLHKGGKVYIEGRLQTSSWEKNGEKKYKTEVVVSDLILLGGKDEAAPSATKVDKTFVTDEDIPF
jgi:single-strand DNA-binding protein